MLQNVRELSTVIILTPLNKEIEIVTLCKCFGTLLQEFKLEQ